MNQFIVIDTDETDGTVCLYNSEMAHQARARGLAAPTETEVTMMLQSIGVPAINCVVWCKTKATLAQGDKVSGRIIGNPRELAAKGDFAEFRLQKR